MYQMLSTVVYIICSYWSPSATTKSFISIFFNHFFLLPFCDQVSLDMWLYSLKFHNTTLTYLWHKSYTQIELKQCFDSGFEQTQLGFQFHHSFSLFLFVWQLAYTFQTLLRLVCNVTNTFYGSFIAFESLIEVRYRAKKENFCYIFLDWNLTNKTFIFLQYQNVR